MSSRIAAAVVLGVLLCATFPGITSAATFAARASLTPNLQYLGDSLGTTFSLAVRNSGSTSSIAAVRIKRPYSAWTITACPGAPAGWTATRTDSHCTYVSSASAADDIHPGQTRYFTLHATTVPGKENRFGTWKVLVSRTLSFSSPANVVQAASMPPGLRTRVFTFEIITAVVRTTPAAPGSACPAANKSANAGTTIPYLVICGRNRATTTLTPKAAYSSLGGSFIAGHGGFTSGPIAPSTSSRVLGSWHNVQVTGVFGTGYTVVARIGASSSRTSPKTTIGGFSATNPPPVVTTSAGATSYTEGDPATVIDGALTVTDANDANLESARVRVSGGFQAGDDLVFVDTPNITGSYNGGTGVLTLTGTDSVANYQGALRSVRFRTPSDDPTTSRTIEFTANDGDSDSAPATKAIVITPVNDSPTVTTSAGSAGYTEGGAAVAVDPALTLTDPDSTTLAGATVSITTNFSASDGDSLNFSNQNGITGSYNSGTGVLTLSGTASLTNYQAALRSITFSVTTDNPSTATRTVSFQVDDGAAANNLSNTATRDVTVGATNDAPTVTASAGSTSYTEGDPATTIDGSLTVTDPDDTNMESAQIWISSGFASGDLLVFVDTPNISGVYVSGTGVLTLTGTDTVANYQTALRSIKYQTTSDNPATSKTISFKVNDGDADSNTTTKTMSITPVNDQPTISTSAPTTATEDTLYTYDADSNDPDGPGATWSVGATDTCGGTINPSTGVYTFTPAGPVPAATCTLDIVINDGGSPDLSDEETATITITAVNDAPTVTTSVGSTSYTEGDPQVTIDSALTVADGDDTNLEGATVSISSGFQSGDALVFSDQNGITGSYSSGTGVLTLSGTSSTANYQTALRSVQFQTTSDDPAASKTISYVANDGDTNSSAATKTISITPVNDAPTVTTTVTALNYHEGDGAVPVDGGLTVSDPDSASLIGATITISTNFASSEDVLAFTNTASITGSWNSGTGTLTLSGSDTVANYQTALRSVTYSNSAVPATYNTRIVSFQVDDGAAANNLSNIATRDIVVLPPNAAPEVTTSVGSTSYTEDDPATTIDGALTVTDADDTNLESGQVWISAGFESGDSLVFTNQNGISGSYNSGTGVLTLTGTSLVANYQTALRSIQFQTTSQAPNTSKTVSFKVNDGVVDSATAIKTLTITSVNDAPTVTTSVGSTAYTEGDPATTIDGSVTVADVDDTNLEGATVSISAGFQSGDALDFTNQNGISGSYNSGTGVLTLTGTATLANYQTALQSIQFQTTSQNPVASKTVSFVVNDGDIDSSAATKTLAITAVNDGPTNTVPGAQSVDEDTVLTFNSANGNLISVADPDSDPSDLRVTLDVDNGTLTLATTSGLSFTVGDGASDATMTFDGTVAEVNAALNGLQYLGDLNYNGSDTLTVTTNDQGNTGSGGALQDQDTVAITVNPVNDAPVADDENFNGADSAVGNTTFIGDDPSDGAPTVSDPSDTTPQATRPHKTITGDILAGDTDVDSPSSAFTVTPGTFATNDGGTVTLQADGDFVFEPAASTSCTDASDFFTYTLNDNDPTDPKTDTGTVTIAISGCVWYVNNNDAQGNSGTSEKPFDTLAQAEAASSAGSTIFVYYGDGTTTGQTAGVNLKATQKLIGEASDLVVGSDTLWTGVSGDRPYLTDNNDDVVALDDGNEVRGFKIDPQGTGGGIAGAVGDTGGGTISDVQIIDIGTPGSQPAFELDSTTGTFNVSNLIVDTSGATSPPSTEIGVRLNGAGTVNFAATGTISITTNGAAALDVDTTSLGTSVFDTIIVTGSGSGGIRLFNVTAGSNTTLGDGSGTDLSLTTTSGATAALLLSSAATVTVPSAGTANVSATGGPAIDISGTTIGGAGLNFDDVDSTNSASTGISLSGLGTGTFSANSSSALAGFTGTAFNVSGGSGAISFAGVINNGGGQSVSITSRTGGTVTLSGNVTDSSDAGGGITVSTNTGGSSTFSGSVTINTTTAGSPTQNNAVVFSASDGHTLTFSGGLSITTTTGKGLDASTSGTLIVTGSSNTITTTSGTALNVVDTDIGASGVTFQSISSNGATSGIILSNTGSSAGLTVAGTGSAGTGGTIQNSTDSGILATSTKSLSLSWMNVSNNGNAVNEGGIRMTNITGTASITSSTVTGGYEDNIYLKNDVSTALTVTIQGPSCSITNNSAASGNNGVNILAATSANVTATVDNCAFSGNRAVSIGADAADDSTLNVTITDNVITQGSPNHGNQGIQVSNAANGSVTFLVDNNKVGTPDGSTASPLLNTGINIFNGSAGNALSVGRVSNNTVINDPTFAPGSSNGFGIRVFNSNLAQMRVRVTNNVVKNVNTDYGIIAESSGATLAPSGSHGRLDIEISGNNTDVNSGALDSIRAQARNFNMVCAKISTNTTDAGGTGFVGIFVRQANSALFDLDGWNGVGLPEAYVAAQNPSAASTGSAGTITGVAAGTCSFAGVP